LIVFFSLIDERFYVSEQQKTWQVAIFGGKVGPRTPFAEHVFTLFSLKAIHTHATANRIWYLLLGKGHFSAKFV
jgi:hypothetical protein